MRMVQVGQMNKNFLEGLPKKRMAAGCLLFDEGGRVLLLKPAYKETWEIPGGIVEEGESPRSGCQREVFEEIGIEHAIGRLLVVDYNSASSVKTDSLMFIFNGGVLKPSEIEGISLNAEELSDYSFFAKYELPQELSPTLNKRILAAWGHYEEGTDVYLENQS